MRTTLVISGTDSDSLHDSPYLKCEYVFKLLCQKCSRLVQARSSTTLLVGAMAVCYVMLLLLTGSE